MGRFHPGNALVSLQSPVAAKKEKKVSCMFIPDGRVSVSAQIDRKGFCEGKRLCCALGGGWWDKRWLCGAGERWGRPS